jgi:hypothetical protein
MREAHFREVANERNMGDEHIHRIVERKGITGIGFFKLAVCRQSVQHIVDAITHMSGWTLHKPGVSPYPIRRPPPYGAQRRRILACVGAFQIPDERCGPRLSPLPREGKPRAGPTG